MMTVAQMTAGAGTAGPTVGREPRRARWVSCPWSSAAPAGSACGATVPSARPTPVPGAIPTSRDGPLIGCPPARLDASPLSGGAAASPCD
jgi:hypothetical protein